MHINKFWAKMKMLFVGVSLMSILTFFINTVTEIFDVTVNNLLFCAIAIISIVIAMYSNNRRRLELESENKV